MSINVLVIGEQETITLTENGDNESPIFRMREVQQKRKPWGEGDDQVDQLPIRHSV